MSRIIFLIAWLAPAIPLAAAEPISLQPNLLHLRNVEPREWSSFPAQAEGTRLEIPFQATVNDAECALRIRQQDVKQFWRVLLNDKPLGDLHRDEADIVFYLPIPPKALLAGENKLVIEAKASNKPAADDVRVGELLIEPKPVHEVLTMANCEVTIEDAESKTPLPSRLTIVNEAGALQMTSASSSDTLAVRPGVIYTANGRAKFSLPAGKYVLYASRGFEYSRAREEISLKPGDSLTKSLTIRREVPTSGLIACDTHVHTLTHSGHGDCTIDERMVTLAGEGIELPIATDHNKHIDYRPIAERLGVNRYFTPVIGNEVTTQVGHFNVFPVEAGARLPNHQLKDWSAIYREIFATPGVQVCLLNHARDIHNGVRPFGPDLFNATSGDNFAGWPMQFNAMEIINSGATQNEPLQLLQDWQALLNRGYQVTPVGSSDSHDVSRYIVGQGRTYIRCDDADVGKIDTATAIKNFLVGKVSVSYGLLVDLTIDDKFASGDLATRLGEQFSARICVRGPHWTKATAVRLYANGQLLREVKIDPTAERWQPPGTLWEETWRIEPPKHDLHLVAVAIGPGISEPFWAMAKPYQPTSPTFESISWGASGAVRIDADRDGRWTSPRGYGERLAQAAKKRRPEVLALALALKEYDAAIATQATHILLTDAKTIDAEEIEGIIQGASPAAAAGMRAAWRAFRDQEVAKARTGLKIENSNEGAAAWKKQAAEIAAAWRLPKNDLPAAPEFPFADDSAQRYQQAYAQARGLPVSLRGPFGMEFVLVPPGEFTMGSPTDEPGRSSEHDETQHAVRLTEAIYLAKHETTVGQFRRFVEQKKYVTDGQKNGGGHAHDERAAWQHRTGVDWQKPGFAGEFTLRDDHPVVHVSQADSLAYCRWLTELSADAVHYTLPTEAEWEWACRAGAGTRFTWGADVDSSGRVANVGDQQLKRIQPKWPRDIMPMNDGHAFLAPVGSYRANAFGLHDMLGNVWEFCSTRTGGYPRKHSVDPGDLDPDRGFAVRGGGWSNVAQDVRCGTRNADPPYFCHSNLGFRVAVKVK